MKKRTIGILLFSFALLGYMMMIIGIKRLLLFLLTITLQYIGLYFIGKSEKEE